MGVLALFESDHAVLLTPTSQKPGATEISYPEPEYSCHLRAATAHSDTLDVCADILTMCIPANNVLKLMVSFCPVPSLSRPVPGSADQLQAGGLPWGVNWCQSPWLSSG